MDYFLHQPAVEFQLIFVVRILVACVLGAIVGLERSLAGKHAGMRTYALVAMGSALFVGGGELLELMYPASALDPSRIAAAVVMGIGFIGSGLAFLRTSEERGLSNRSELTTAAGIWVVSAIGVACGLGLYVLGVGAALITVIIFTSLMRLELAAEKRFHEKGVRSLD